MLACDVGNLNTPLLVWLIMEALHGMKVKTASFTPGSCSCCPASSPTSRLYNCCALLFGERNHP
jgi:hypothetical protein